VTPAKANALTAINAQKTAWRTSWCVRTNIEILLYRKAFNAGMFRPNGSGPRVLDRELSGGYGRINVACNHKAEWMLERQNRVLLAD
jgi:hypothetical protein